ncbi:hydroxyacylglutathione hydrolase [Limnohabitans sp.]|uniref:hydroxyacylglutathione hydrolase n=1 Tax=Limnohabitans sp. TaxID=1907725 RepID=UPI002AFDE8BD|nr:hydroxyacylglutathione hydrolase [Limnohabitans sp.]
MKLIALPAFSDNYIWLLHNDQHALVVDPGDSAPVLSWLEKNPSVALDRILVTHHHADHTGGLPELVAQTGAQVFGPALEKMPLPAQGLQQGDMLEWQGLTLMVHDVPGHTLGHIAFWLHPPGQAPILFCGDTLFSGGCGRLFEGSPAQMLDSLDRLAALPDETRVCCAHEYTLSNLKFALVVDPENLALKSYAQQCMQLREQNQATLPGLLSTERAINPFLRSRSPTVTLAVQQRDKTAIDDVSSFAALRNWKNEF